MDVASPPQLSVLPYKGTRDFYPEEMGLREHIFSQFRDIARRFSFHEYGGPLLEPFELYASKTGEEIVNNQLYSFTDRGDRKVAIRPEMTPTLARMVAAKIGELQPPLRWFSIPNLYRYERPQKGRLREHWQLNVDILGGENELADLEILIFLRELFVNFGAKTKMRIRLNHRGWVDYYLSQVMHLDPEKTKLFAKILDAKEKVTPEVFERELLNLQFSSQQRERFDEYLKADLKSMVAKYSSSPLSELFKVSQLLQDPDFFVYDPTIMRGLDYYTGLIFEGFDLSSSNRRAIFGGGRYDNLVGLFGKNQISGIGFGLGDVVLMDFLAENNLLPSIQLSCDFFITIASVEFLGEALKVAETLRSRNFSVSNSLKVSSFKSQLKSADRSGAKYAILFGEEEWKEKKLIVRDLKNSSQLLLTHEEIAEKDFGIG